MNVVELTESTFDEVVGGDTAPVLVDVTAEWCPPCRQMEPVLEELAGEEAGALVVGRLDADAHPDVARRLGVMSFPTFVLFVAGEERGRFIGARGKGRLREDLRSVLG
jgi:thioredoxin 1